MTWQKGQSGNPAGKAKTGKRLTDVLRKLLDEPAEDGKTKADKLAEVLYSMATKGANLDAVRYIYDRLDGKPIEPREISGSDGSAISVALRWGNGDSET